MAAAMMDAVESCSVMVSSKSVTSSVSAAWGQASWGRSWPEKKSTSICMALRYSLASWPAAQHSPSGGVRGHDVVVRYLLKEGKGGWGGSGARWQGCMGPCAVSSRAEALMGSRELTSLAASCAKLLRGPGILRMQDACHWNLDGQSQSSRGVPSCADEVASSSRAQSWGQPCRVGQLSALSAEVNADACRCVVQVISYFDTKAASPLP